MCFNCLGKTEAISVSEPFTFDLAPLKKHGLLTVITEASNYVYMHTNIPMFL